MTEAVRRAVFDRANGKCKYCRLAVRFDAAPWHVDHIRPRQHGGTAADDNLALACFRCNASKGPNLSGVDPMSGSVITLFNPRTDRWEQHFALIDAEITGITPIGRATVCVLKMNAENRIALRSLLLDEGH